MKKFLVTNKGSSFYGQELEFLSVSPLDNWGAIILRTSYKGNSEVFREGEFKSI